MASMKFLFKKNDLFYSQVFPAMEADLQRLAQLLNVHQFNKLQVEEVVYPEGLSYMKGMEVDVDEINFLSKVMSGYDVHETTQFLAGAEVLKPTTVKDLINMAFNLQRFTVITDLNDLAKAGLTHRLTREGSVSVAASKDTVALVAVGKQLLRSGKGILTKQGLLFLNEDLPCEDVYNGRTFPEYLYEQDVYTLSVEHGNDIEYLYLPTKETAIQKALGRLGVEDEQDCNCYISEWYRANGPLMSLTNRLLSYDLKTQNKVAEALADSDLEKIDAMIRAYHLVKSEELIRAADLSDGFVFVPDITTDKELGRYWLDHDENLYLEDSLQPFFDFAAYGKQVQCATEGKILPDGGYIGTDGLHDLSDLLKTIRNGEQTLTQAIEPTM